MKKLNNPYGFKKDEILIFSAKNDTVKAIVKDESNKQKRLSYEKAETSN